MNCVIRSPLKTSLTMHTKYKVWVITNSNKRARKRNSRGKSGGHRHHDGHVRDHLQQVVCTEKAPMSMTHTRTIQTFVSYTQHSKQMHAQTTHGRQNRKTRDGGTVLEGCQRRASLTTSNARCRAYEFRSHSQFACFVARNTNRKVWLTQPQKPGCEMVDKCTDMPLFATGRLRPL